MYTTKRVKTNTLIAMPTTTGADFMVSRTLDEGEAVGVGVVGLAV